jgi:hypothetical protein
MTQANQAPTPQPQTSEKKDNSTPRPGLSLKSATVLLGATVIGSVLAYCGLYEYTKSNSRDWFAVPAQETRVEPGHSPDADFASTKVDYINQIKGNVSQESEVSSLADMQDVIASKQQNIEVQKRRWQDQLESLKVNSNIQEKDVQDIKKILSEMTKKESPKEIKEKLDSLDTIFRKYLDLESTEARLVQTRISSHEQVRLLEQIEASTQGAEKHAGLALHFHSQAKASVILSLVLGVTAGTLGVLISRDGWEKTDNSYIIAFALMSTTALFFTQFPRILQSDNNFQNNRDIYLGYLTLENQIRSFVATEGGIGDDPENKDKFSRIDTNRFIHSVDNKLSELNQLSISIDSNQRVNVSSVLNIPAR